MANDFLFTSESVSEGHPDKVADQISDAILDAILAQDPRARVAAETLTNTGLVVLAGEISANAHVDYIQVARDTDSAAKRRAPAYSATALSTWCSRPDNSASMRAASRASAGLP